MTVTRNILFEHMEHILFKTRKRMPVSMLQYYKRKKEFHHTSSTHFVLKALK